MCNQIHVFKWFKVIIIFYAIFLEKFMQNNIKWILKKYENNIKNYNLLRTPIIIYKNLILFKIEINLEPIRKEPNQN